MTNSSQAAAAAAAAAQATDPVAEGTRLEGNGAAPSTNTEEIQDTWGKKAGGGVAMATTIVMAGVATAAEPGGGCSGESSWLPEQSVLFEA